MAAKKKIRYHVFREVDAPSDAPVSTHLESVETDVEATGSGDAIKQAAVRLDAAGTDASGTYVAIPVRSFAPQTVKIETKKAVVIGGGS